jgi:hypothetical protein
MKNEIASFWLYLSIIFGSQQNRTRKGKIYPDFLGALGVDADDSKIGINRKILRDKIAYVFEDKFLETFVKPKIINEFSMNNITLNY